MSRILVADDDPAVRVAMAWTLLEAGHEVTLACDGKEALALLKKSTTPFDLVIADILMPKMDGFELILEFKKILPQMKVIAVSGGGFFCGGEVMLEISARFGATKVLEKPVSSSRLKSAVHKVLTGRPQSSSTQTGTADLEDAASEKIAWVQSPIPKSVVI
ncbi:MAG TPA: response regulator [Verrucomicrobiae bacterium]|nr:response regulator [Verrucomicrobiae bacterium]